ncbi:MAG: hypothetical protein LQ349_000807 [Xanthoria aureola]|nr:MAG: hypothetical protein LQ349_000807 [Xanthoria aureola]
MTAPEAMMTMAPNTPSNAEVIWTASSQYTNAVVCLAAKTIRYDAIKQEETQKIKEYARFSRYAETFPTIGEDRAQSQKVIDRELKVTQVDIDHARQEVEKAIDTVFRVLLTTGDGGRVTGTAETSIGSAAKDWTNHDEETMSMKEQITSLEERLSHIETCRESDAVDIRNQVQKKDKLSIGNLDKITVETKNLKDDIKAKNTVIHKLQSEVSNSSKTVSSISDYHSAIKVPFQNLIQSSRAQDKVLEEVVSHQEVPSSTLQHVLRDIDEKFSGYRDTMEKRLQRMESKHENMHSKFEAMEKTETERDEAVSQEIGQVWNLAILLEKEQKKQTQDSTGAIDNQNGTSLEQLFNEMKALRDDQQDQANKIAQSSITVDQLASDVKRLGDTAKDRTESWETLKSDIKMGRRELDDIRSNQGEIKSQIEALKRSLPRSPGMLQQENLQSEASCLRTPHHHDTQTRISPVQGISDRVQIERMALESKVDLFEREIADKVKAIECTVASHDSRFNNMTTEPLINSIIHTLHQMYPLQALRDIQGNHSYLVQQLAMFHRDLNTILRSRDDTDRNFKQQILHVEQKFTNYIAQQDQAADYLKQEITAIKQERDDLTHSIRQAKNQHDQFARQLDTEREADGKKFAEMERFKREITDHTARLDQAGEDLKREVTAIKQERDDLIHTTCRARDQHNRSAQQVRTEHEAKEKQLAETSTFKQKFQSLTTRINFFKNEESRELERDSMPRFESTVENLGTQTGEVVGSAEEQIRNLEQVSDIVVTDRDNSPRVQTETQNEITAFSKDLYNQTETINALNVSVDANTQNQAWDDLNLERNVSKVEESSEARNPMPRGSKHNLSRSGSLDRSHKKKKEKKNKPTIGHDDDSDQEDCHESPKPPEPRALRSSTKQASEQSHFHPRSHQRVKSTQRRRK